MAAISAEGLLRFTRHDIPEYAEEPLCMIAAALAAPEFERTPDSGWVMQGMVMIARAVHNNSTGTVPFCAF